MKFLLFEYLVLQLQPSWCAEAFQYFIDFRLHNLEMCWDLSKPNNSPTCFVYFRKIGSFSVPPSDCTPFSCFIPSPQLYSLLTQMQWGVGFVVPLWCHTLYACSKNSSKMLDASVEIPSKTQDTLFKIVIISGHDYKAIGLLSLVIALEVRDHWSSGCDRISAEEYHWNSSTSSFL